MEYSHLYSQYPTALLDLTANLKKDVDADVIGLVNQYLAYMSEGNIGAANELYNANKDVLESYKIGMKDFNLLLEEVFNIGLHALGNSTLIVSTEQPATMAENGIWYKIIE